MIFDDFNSFAFVVGALSVLLLYVFGPPCLIYGIQRFKGSPTVPRCATWRPSLGGSFPRSPARGHQVHQQRAHIHLGYSDQRHRESRR